MTNDELLEDLKQFVRDSVSGPAAQTDVNARFDALHTEMRDLHSEVVDGMSQQTETIVASIETLDRRHTARLEDHEGRISTLERHAA
ncbi:hypothetical protein G5V59_13060 [Nocardioides sp. W3-2-3]|uniref:hypothetical protein n=1 Tax=Nocardioides convexus TaxID=2712224 RepID=UPI0024188260|nr:hypothetical protein [Nocardioides convexus]NHA00641.1 hypothetical protein [Nocardioides convexus]